MRTTVDDVKNILDGTQLDNITIDGYINSANIFVTSTLGNKGLGGILLEQIEMWMTAHMISVTRERIAKEAGAGGAYIKYAGNWGEGLLATGYGQMAVALDTSGTLTDLAKQKSSAWVKAVPNFNK